MHIRRRRREKSDADAVEAQDGTIIRVKEESLRDAGGFTPEMLQGLRANEAERSRKERQARS